MDVIRISDGNLDFGGKPIFRNINFRIDYGRRFGLVGANGSGKSTLLRVISGEIHLDGGSLVIREHTKIGYLPQVEPKTFSSEPLIERVMAGDHELTAIQKQMEKVEKGDTLSNEDMDRYNLLHDQFAIREGYTMEIRAEKLLNGLGFRKEDFHLPVKNFSGGWRMRAELARILFTNPDILLLDEPTNHLDLDSLLFLENYLKTFKGGVLLVSHDRNFLDNTVVKIYEIERGALKIFHGNYSYYEKEKKKETERQWKAYEAQQDEIARIKRFIDKFRARKDMAPMVKSRIKYLEKMVKIEPPVVSRKVRFNFPEPERSGRVALRIENLTKSFDEKHVLRGLNLTLERGDRLALTGPNGTGKSTLSKILAGMEKPDSGKIEWGHKVKTGYFAQEQAELMWSEQKVMDELRSAAPSQTTHELRSLLGAFLFDNEDVSKKVRVLSGGEKCRLSIARLLLRRYNFYILDEPTNHLDISSKDVLVQALDNFTGTFILVSHDRYVLERVCNKVAEIVDGKLVVYPGTYDEYLDMKEKHIREQEEEISKADNIGKNEKKRSRRRSGGSKAEKRRAAARLREKKKELTKIEKLIGEMEENQERIDSALADPDLFRTDGLAAKFVADRNHTVSKLMELYDEWSRLAQEIEDGEKKDNQNEK